MKLTKSLLGSYMLSPLLTLKVVEEVDKMASTSFTIVTIITLTDKNLLHL
jgi:hypothetical protein